ncbi:MULTISPECIES: hypothetical protein [unclassified Paracoccus (in: a-proteobacteria)]|uniref:hypothetical protein n=1 Tax=unclassified Paracoccus (in: a-proteobacteria) TaxID=2688777 RepID=UPI0012B2EB7C|nr:MULTISPECIES: hypothetical protein [unclassified Paracoccus (in: a-proteobacteria)]UXU73828.1 hypothetical protein GB879_007730 [Paracoccus sp. SMMA_5]UXU79716.1 hypothetical protein GB880_007710 [Paracoccus sp. SMMA_5_TC]
MAEAEAGLELPIGLTEQKFLQQLARIEARAIKSARIAEQAFVKSNSGIARSTTGMSNQVRGQLQNVSFQLQDVIVQIQGGTSASRALAQQLPQLLGGFGALGSALGLVAGLGIPFVASLMNMEEEAVDLDKAVKGLTEALEALRDAQANAAIPVDLLIEKYGALGDEMGRVFQNQLAIARQELEAVGASIEKAIGSTAELTSMVTRFDSLKQAVDAGVISYDEYIRLLRDLEQQFGFTAAQALQYQNLMDGVANAQGPEQQAQAWLDVHDWLVANRDALSEQGVAVDDLIKQTNDLAGSYGKAHEAASDITSAAEAGAVATDNWAAAAANLAANMDGAAAAAGRAAAAVGAAIAAQNKAAGLSGVGELDPFSASSGRVLTAIAGGMNIPQQADFDRQWQEQVKAQEEAAKAAERAAARSSGGGRKRGGGGRRSSGGGASAAREVDIFESATREIQQLERQIELFGKSEQEAARLQARWAMLDAAKRAGVPVNEQLNAQIEAQAAQVGALTQQLEQADLAQEQFDQAIEGIANAFSNAILEGENLRDSLAQIFRQIAANILNAGIQQALTQAFSGAGGGGGIFGILASAFGGTRAAVPTFDGGGFTGRGSRSGGVDGKGGFPAILHPNETVIDHTRGQGGIAPKITINNNAPGAVVSADYVTKDEVILTVSQAIASNNRRQSDQQYLRGGR